MPTKRDHRPDPHESLPLPPPDLDRERPATRGITARPARRSPSQGADPVPEAVDEAGVGGVATRRVAATPDRRLDPARDEPATVRMTRQLSAKALAKVEIAATGSRGPAHSRQRRRPAPWYRSRCRPDRAGSASVGCRAGCSQGSLGVSPRADADQCYPPPPALERRVDQGGVDAVGVDQDQEVAPPSRDRR